METSHLTISSNDRRLITALIDWLNKQELTPDTDTTLRLHDHIPILTAHEGSPIVSTGINKAKVLNEKS